MRQSNVGTVLTIRGRPDWLLGGKLRFVGRERAWADRLPLCARRSLPGVRSPIEATLFCQREALVASLGRPPRRQSPPGAQRTHPLAASLASWPGWACSGSWRDLDWVRSSAGAALSCGQACRRSWQCRLPGNHCRGQHFLPRSPRQISPAPRCERPLDSASGAPPGGQQARSHPGGSHCYRRTGG